MLNDELRVFFSGGLGAPRGRHRSTAQGRRDGGVASPRWRATARAPRQPQMAARRVGADGSAGHGRRRGGHRDGGGVGRGGTGAAQAWSAAAWGREPAQGMGA